MDCIRASTLNDSIPRASARSFFKGKKNKNYIFESDSTTIIEFHNFQAKNKYLIILINN
jgi:hypothetical protein